MDGPEGDGQGFENLLCAIRRRLLEMAKSTDALPTELADALSHLDAEVWAAGYGEQKRLNIIDALRDARLTGSVFCRVVDEWKGGRADPDWLEVGSALGLPLPDLTSAPRLMTRVLVTPDNMLTVRLTRAGNGAAAR